MHIHKIYLFILAVSLIFSCTESKDQNIQTLQINQAETLLEQKQYPDAFHIAHQLLASPYADDETGVNDSTPSVYHRALRCIYSIGIHSREYDKSIALLDSLYQTDSVVRQRCPHSLVAYLSHLLQYSGDCKRAMTIAREYERLPRHSSDRVAHLESLESISYPYLFCMDSIAGAIHLLETARNEYYQGTYTPLISSVLIRLAASYRDNGQYENAVKTNLEAIDFCRSHPDSPLKLMAYGEISNTYRILGMNTDALRMNDEAIRIANDDPIGLGNLYTFRSDIFSDLQEWDSVFYYLQKGRDAFSGIGSSRGVFMTKLNEIVALHNSQRDSSFRVKTIINELCTDSARMPQMFRQTLRTYIGKELIHDGYPEQGLPLIAGTAKVFQQMQLTDMEMNSLDVLMQEYATRGMSKELLEHFERYKSLRDTLNKEERLQITASSYIRFETDRKEQRIQQLSIQMKLRTRTLYYNIALSITLLFLLGISIAYIIVRNKSNRIQMEANKRDMQNIIDHQKKLNYKNEVLMQEIKKVTISNQTEEVLKLSTQNLLSREDENEFRQAFNRLYPSFLKCLRENHSLTRTEELVSMLIFLNYRSEEIALILGINKQSVNITRSHIRKKMDLAKTESLEEALLKYHNKKVYKIKEGV